MMQNIEGTETESFAQRVKKLADSQPVISNGMEYNGLYELNNKSAEKYLRANFRGNYLNADTGNLIRITRKGAEKVTRHDAENMAHLKSLATYYDLALTPIEKNKLLRSIDEIKRPFASKESSDDGEQVSDVLSECKDKRLISILQIK